MRMHDAVILVYLVLVMCTGPVLASPRFVRARSFSPGRHGPLPRGNSSGVEDESGSATGTGGLKDEPMGKRMGVKNMVRDVLIHIDAPLF